MRKFILVLSTGLLLLSSCLIIHALPQGNYIDTCKHCRIDDGTLSCKCQNANQQYAHRSYVDNAKACTTIENINGYLTCTGGYQPRGNYDATCKRCRVDNGTLSCKCQNANQKYTQRSYLNNANACISIENIDGALTCTGGYDNTNYQPHHNKTHKKWKSVDAGPIFSNAEAQTTCPKVCGNAKHWNGQWNTQGVTSYCQCKRHQK
jgi:hypothetical protein